MFIEIKKLIVIIGATTLGSLSFALASSKSIENAIKVKAQIPLKLYVLDCGQIKANDISLFNPTIKKGTKKDLANACYLVKHPKGTLLWDTGLSDELIHKKQGIEVLNGAFHMSVKKTLKSQLEKISSPPSQINYIAFSHLHNDHTGNATLFSKSKWLMQEPEYELAFGPMAQNYGYQVQDYKSVGAKVEKLKGVHDVFNDGSVVLLPTPGHSPGHQSLFVDLPKTGPIIIAGDLYHFEENRESYGIPVWNSKKETIHSFAGIDNLLDKHKATLWIQHDKALFDSQRHAPEFYE